MTIIFDEVSFRYFGAVAKPGSATAGWSLRHIKLQIDPGELIAIMGQNGAGKSTLCLTINGLIPHFFKGDLRGHVIVNEQDTQESSINQMITQVGMLFQNPFDQLTGVTETVFEEVAFGPENLGLPLEEIESRVESALEAAGVSPLAERHPYALSGGQQQRVALAAVLAMKPQVLVLDEPTSQLDPIGSDEVFQVLFEMHRKGQTLILAEHKVEAIAELATRVIVLHEGKVVLDGSPRQVLTHADLPAYRVLPPGYTRLGQEINRRGHRTVSLPPLTIDEAQSMLTELGVHGPA